MLSLRWYESITRHYTIECGVRGSHAYGPAILRSGDIFGFFSNETEVPEVNRILVYPRLVPIEQLGLPPKLPLATESLRCGCWKTLCARPAFGSTAQATA